MLNAAAQYSNHAQPLEGQHVLLARQSRRWGPLTQLWNVPSSGRTTPECVLSVTAIARRDLRRRSHSQHDSFLVASSDGGGGIDMF